MTSQSNAQLEPDDVYDLSYSCPSQMTIGTNFTCNVTVWADGRYSSNYSQVSPWRVAFALVLEGGGIYGNNGISGSGCSIVNDNSTYFDSSIYPNPSTDGYDVKWCWDTLDRCNFFECASNACQCGRQSSSTGEYEHYPTHLKNNFKFNIAAPKNLKTISPKWVRLSLWIALEGEYYIIQNYKDQDWYNYTYSVDVQSMANESCIMFSIGIMLLNYILS